MDWRFARLIFLPSSLTARVSAIIYRSMLHAQEMQHLLSAETDGSHVITPNPEAQTSLHHFAASHEETRGLFFFQTSGSEGLAKWVGLSREALFVSATNINQHLESSYLDRWLISLPLHHVGGFSILVRAHVSGASILHDTEKWDPHRFAKLCQQHQITLTSLVPTQVFDLVQHQIEAPPQLRAIVVGGGSLQASLGQRAQALGWPVLPSYGMTETASQVATAPLSQLQQGFDPDVMEVLPHWQLRTEQDSQRLIIRGAALAKGYAVQSGVEPTAHWVWQPIQDEFVSRDFVKFWHHGTRQYLQMLGRESHYLKVKGELINLHHIQQNIELLLPGAAVCPLPDPRRETKLVLAWLSSQYRNVQVESALSQYHQRCSPSERIHEHRSVLQIPKTELGKLNLPLLQTQLLSQAC